MGRYGYQKGADQVGTKEQRPASAAQRNSGSRFYLGPGWALGRSVVSHPGRRCDQSRVAGEPGSPAPKPFHSSTRSRTWAQFHRPVRRYERKQTGHYNQRSHSTGSGINQTIGHCFRHRHREFQFQSDAKMGPGLRCDAETAAGHYLCVHVRFRSHRPAPQLRYHSYGTMGPSAQALSGMTFLSGLPGKPPAGWGWSYLDDTGGMYGAMCALAAMRHRNVTGRGQHVDLSQMITGITLTGPAFLDHTVNGRKSRRPSYPPGNRAVWPDAPVVNNYRGLTVAPHNAYRTKGGGYNDWCVIACFFNEEWHSLVRLMGSPPWAVETQYGNLAGRIKHQEAMDQGIESWTQTMDKYELTEKCQGERVRAMPVHSSENRVEHDPQLRHRGMYSELEHQVLGRWKFQNAPSIFPNLRLG